MIKQHIKKGLIFFFDLKVSLHLVLAKYNLRIMLGSKSKIFKNIEARQKVGYSYKKMFISHSSKYFTVLL